MPTDRPRVASLVEQPKLDVVRLEDRLTPATALTADSLLSFAPNPILDFGTTTTPTVPSDGGNVSTSTIAPTATSAPAVDPVAASQYELVLPMSGGDSPTADSSGGTFALFSIVPPPPAASLSGYVYVDEGAGGGTRNDGIKQAGEPGIPGATVTLLRVVNGVTIPAGSTTTDSTGFYSFPSLSPFGEYQLVETQPAGFLDGKDTAGTVNGTTVGTATNDFISGIVLNASESGINYNFGELLPVPPPGALSGFVYVDEGAGGGTRDDGIKQAGEPGIAGTTVTLFRVLNGVTTSVAQTTTDAGGFYQFTNLPSGGGYLVRETQPANYLDGKDTAGSTGGSNAVNDDLSAITVPAGGESTNNNFGELLPPPPPAQLSGYVYVDEGAGGGTRDDGVKQAGEPGIAGATVTLFRVVSGVTTSVGQTTTDNTGFYSFTNLPAGTYEVRETQPANFLDGKDTPGSTGGSNATNDVLASIPLVAGANSVNNNFGELLPPPPPAQLSGFVYVDADNDGIKDSGEAPIPGTSVTLFRIVSGVATSVGQTTTDASGFYSFTNLPAGSYEVRETQPANFLDGKDTPGSTGGSNATNDVLTGIPLVAGANSVNNNFGELLPARLSGFEYVDEGAGGGTRDDGIKQAGEPGIGGVVITLTGTDDLGAVSRTATTAADGSYSFENLRPGSYVVAAGQPASFLDGKDTPGSTGGLNVVNDVLSGIPLVSGANSINNNFGELLPPPPPPGSLSGFVYEDNNNDGVKDANEAGIAGTTLTLFRVVGGVTTSVGQTTTDGTGFYQFSNLTPGDGYRVVEAQPSAYADGKDTAGSTGGTNTVNDQLDAISVPVNAASVNNNFGERLGQLSGFVYVDTNNDGVKDVGEAPIPGTTITLFRLSGGVATSIGQTTTDASGFYQFTRLAPGSYEVRETQPAGFLDGKDTPDAGNGGTTPSNDVISTIGIAGAFDLDSPNNNFGELLPPPPPPAQLSGYVYVDEGSGGGVRNDGIKQAGEPGIPGTSVTLFRIVNGVATSVGQTTTDASGFYSFTNLPAGSYEVRETQPANFLDGKDTPGSTGGSNATNDVLTGIPLVAGANSVNNNFGELRPFSPPPPPPLGAVSGYVYYDINDNGIKDAGEPGIPGAIVDLYVVHSPPVFQGRTTTDANGFYQFVGLAPGGGYRVVETQPVGYLDGKDTPGSTGGNNSENDVLAAIPVPAGGTSTNNNFGELLPVSLYGYVWFDANRDSHFNPSEIGLGGATVTLTGTTLSGLPVTKEITTTDAFGRYAFTGLLPGIYSVVQSNTPVGYTDFHEENAARLVISGGSSPLSFSTFTLTRDAGPLNFGKVLDSEVVSPPPSSPQRPGEPSKLDFLGSTSSGSGVTVPPSGTGQQLPQEAGPFNPSILGPTGPTQSPRLYAVASAPGTPATVRVFDATTGGERFRIRPFEESFLGGATVAIGDVNGDGIDDVIVGAGAGGGPRVSVFDGNTGTRIYDFYAYDQNFTGGVYVASGDVDGDGYADIVTGAGAGGGPHVKVFSGKTGQMIQSFYAFDQSNSAGVRVAVGDFNGDGRADIGTATGAGVASQIVTYDALTLAVFSRLQPFESAFLGGVNLAAGDVNGDGIAELIAGAGSGGGPRVRVMNAISGATVFDFYATDSSFTGGVSVAARDLNADGKADIVTGLGAGVQSTVQVLSGVNLAPLDSFFAFESTNKNGIFVG